MPRHIDWGPEYEYDLSDASDAAVMYERVIREAQSGEDLAQYLEEARLRRLWSRLVLPIAVQRAWEGRFPELAREARAA